MINTPACGAYRQPFGAGRRSIELEETRELSMIVIVVILTWITIAASFYAGRNYERVYHQKQLRKMQEFVRRRRVE